MTWDDLSQRGHPTAPLGIPPNPPRLALRPGEAVDHKALHLVLCLASQEKPRLMSFHVLSRPLVKNMASSETDSLQNRL